MVFAFHRESSGTLLPQIVIDGLDQVLNFCTPDELVVVVKLVDHTVEGTLFIYRLSRVTAEIKCLANEFVDEVYTVTNLSVPLELHAEQCELSSTDILGRIDSNNRYFA